MPAPFIRDLCGYRSENSKPNMSDSNDDQSIRLGARLIQHLGVPEGHPGPSNPGAEVEDMIVKHLHSLRPDLSIARSRPATDFVQYAHLKVFSDFHRGYVGSTAALAELSSAINRLPDSLERAALEGAYEKLGRRIDEDDRIINTLKQETPQESLLKIDVSVGVPRKDGTEELAVALSSKWSLRTDRAQDCVSQGNKLVTHRRGRMPHFAVITIETRPAMLKILADGSGAIDCVYHLDLATLAQAIAEEAETTRTPRTWSPRLTFERIYAQRRVQDFDELAHQVMRLPSC